MKKALENALTMEKHVTGSIRNVIDNCNEDYHVSCSVMVVNYINRSIFRNILSFFSMSCTYSSINQLPCHFAFNLPLADDPSLIIIKNRLCHLYTFKMLLEIVYPRHILMTRQQSLNEKYLFV